MDRPWTTTLLISLAVALAACGAPPPPRAASDEQVVEARAADESVKARLSALEARMNDVEARTARPATKVPPPEVATDPPLTGPVLVAEHHYRVPRGYFDRMVNDPESTMREVRLVPTTSGGRRTGLKLSGMRPESRMAALGFQNGDQLESLNDLPLATPEQALEAYAAARSADSLRVRLLRNGQRIELRYDLVD